MVDNLFLTDDRVEVSHVTSFSPIAFLDIKMAVASFEFILRSNKLAQFDILSQYFSYVVFKFSINILTKI